jgi:hypothetical protein
VRVSLTLAPDQLDELLRLNSELVLRTVHVQRISEADLDAIRRKVRAANRDLWTWAGED